MNQTKCMNIERSVTIWSIHLSVPSYPPIVEIKSVGCLILSEYRYSNSFTLCMRKSIHDDHKKTKTKFYQNKHFSSCTSENLLFFDKAWQQNCSIHSVATGKHWNPTGVSYRGYCNKTYRIAHDCFMDQVSLTYWNTEGQNLKSTLWAGSYAIWAHVTLFSQPLEICSYVTILSTTVFAASVWKRQRKYLLHPKSWHLSQTLTLCLPRSSRNQSSWTRVGFGCWVPRCNLWWLFPHTWGLWG